MQTDVRPLWSPLVAGLALGLSLLFAFILTGHGLGASGFFTRLTAWLGGEAAPAATHANSYFGPFVKHGNPLSSWITWEIIGMAIGALAAAMTSGRFRFQLDGATRLGVLPRIALAFGGGILAGFGSRIASGCTSGMGLSGTATLAVAGFLFLIGFFVSGLLVSWMMRRAWQ